MNTIEDLSDTTEVEAQKETSVIDLEGLHFPPDSTLADGCSLQDVLKEARGFHTGDQTTLSTVSADLLPAVMHTLRRPSLIRTDYPLVLRPSGSVQPLAEFFDELITKIDDAKVLADNLLRIERQIRDTLKSVTDASKAISTAGAVVADSLGLNDKANQAMRNKGVELVDLVPAGAKLVPCSAATGPTVALHMIAATASDNTLHQDAIAVRDALRSMNSKETTVNMIGSDAAKMREVLGKTATGSLPMNEERIKRINHAIEVIEQWIAQGEKPLYVIRSDDAIAFEVPSNALVIEAGNELCQKAITKYDDMATRFSSLFGALRTARLELANAFERPRHDHLLENFSANDFSTAELNLLPKIVCVGTVSDGMANMAALSAILRSSRPITLVLLGDDLASLDHERIELAYLAVAHRQAFASQVSIALPSHMIESFQCGLDSVRPALHTVASEDTHPLGAWLEGNAAIEGRACPLIRYNPSSGSTWADRFDLSDNPQPEHDWPVWSGEIAGKQLDFSFTFAHCALLNPELHQYFSVLPDGIESNNLRPIQEWLHLSPEDATASLPFLWAADVEGAIHKVLISRVVTAVCRERLDYWRTLSELAGIGNEHVRRALAEAQIVMDEKLATQRESLQEEHASEIASIRSTASQVAMQQLAQVLLSGGGGMVNPMSTLQSQLIAPPPQQHDANGTVSAAQEVAKESSDTEPESATEDMGEAWIDSPICTTCNDCMDVNPQVFVYNEDKQAYIKDASAGTYEEIVRAAEACPARCIHPGGPLNQNEPNLDDLKKRAAEFN